VRSKLNRLARTVLLLLCVGPLVACETLDQVSRIYLSATPEGRQLIERWDHYAKIADTLKTYKDSGHLSDQEVLDVLIGVGVIDAPSSGGGSAPHEPPMEPPASPAGRWRWPMEAGVISSEFGARGGRAHEGMDIAADPREPIFAANSGEVIYSNDGLSGYGNTIILRHDDRTTSLYAHATTLEVAKGNQVSRGSLIATVGTTGRSTGPHLHFEVRVGETALDPRSVLPRHPF
jgi:murein DD-endopeptidase MepM/ murein hydrolase activator NlpD